MPRILELFAEYGRFGAEYPIRIVVNLAPCAWL